MYSHSYLFFRKKQKRTKEKAHNNKQDLSKQHIDNDDGYSTVQASTLSQRLANESSSNHPTPPALLLSTGPSAEAQTQTVVNDIYSMALDDLPPQIEVSISPYACFYGTRNSAAKAGWLDKLSPQG